MLPIRGPVARDDAAFVPRSLEHAISLALGRGEYVSLRGGRQTGKTTTALSLARTLTDAGAAVSYVDLEGLRPVSEATVGEWLSDLVRTVAESLGVTPEAVGDLLPINSGSGIIEAFLRLADAAGKPVVVMLDEVTAAPLSLQPVFFSALRALFNLRKDIDGDRSALSERLSFMLIGTFDPDKLIDDQNSPFNVSHDFDTVDYDFDAREVARLCVVAGVSPDLAVDIHRVSGGHPYLTNVIIERVSSGSTVDAAVEQLLLSSDPNLLQLASRLAGLEPRVITLLKRIAAGEVQVPISRGVLPELDRLFSAGLVRSGTSGYPEIRSQIYLAYVQRFEDTASYLGSEGIGIAAASPQAEQPTADFDVGIVVALREELAAVLAVVEQPTRVTHESRTYYTATVPYEGGEHKVVVTLLTIMGNVESALAANDLMHAFNPRAILVVGIAAGVDSASQAFGDVVIAESIYYYEFQKVFEGGVQARPRMTPTSRALYGRAQNLEQSLPVHFGVVASGEQVIADGERVAELLEEQPKLVGIEMESAGVCAAALGQSGNTQFLAIRGISDFADKDKDDTAHEMAAQSAAKYARAYLEAGPLE